jgi:hypothetical protein
MEREHKLLTATTVFNVRDHLHGHGHGHGHDHDHGPLQPFQPWQCCVRIWMDRWISATTAREGGGRFRKESA